MHYFACIKYAHGELGLIQGLHQGTSIVSYRHQEKPFALE
jgi:hypothetical protein